ncbi:unnamed protein product [Darwinula stevensoni]|uniref:c-SKI SMAD4-binding domain-containing protein n=1 Tax=Darwinula stevensoni TaxID=69355 RepID=A0A7R9AB99_9CRUS|nr:unnamed protein product [Darwinula stevensoni]CAG0899218.1 unnamed protein product [Darwinula stevensoni]
MGNCLHPSARSRLVEPGEAPPKWAGLILSSSTPYPPPPLDSPVLSASSRFATSYALARMEATTSPDSTVRGTADKLAMHADPSKNQVGEVMLEGTPIVSLVMDGTERLCLAQISNTLLRDFSYNEIHNRRVALGITCVQAIHLIAIYSTKPLKHILIRFVLRLRQCTPVQLELLRRAGAMPVSSRRCGMISKREAERLCKSFLGDNAPPRLPENFAFDVFHECGWGCRGAFVPSRYNSSRAKCVRCHTCALYFSPNKFIFHSHRGNSGAYRQPDAANFNAWRRHLQLYGEPSEDVLHAWEDVKAMFNGGTRKRMLAHSLSTRIQAAYQAKRIRPTGGGEFPGGAGNYHPFPPLPLLPPPSLLSSLSAPSFAAEKQVLSPPPSRPPSLMWTGLWNGGALAAAAAAFPFPRSPLSFPPSSLTFPSPLTPWESHSSAFKPVHRPVERDASDGKDSPSIRCEEGTAATLVSRIEELKQVISSELSKLPNHNTQLKLRGSSQAIHSI